MGRDGSLRAPVVPTAVRGTHRLLVTATGQDGVRRVVVDVLVTLR